MHARPVLPPFFRQRHDREAGHQWPAACCCCCGTAVPLERLQVSGEVVEVAQEAVGAGAGCAEVQACQRISHPPGLGRVDAQVGADSAQVVIAGAAAGLDAKP